MNKAFQLSAIFLLLQALVLANAWFLYATFRKVGDHQAWVTHTNTVMSELNLLRASVVDVESGQRGFLLTGEVDKHLFSVNHLDGHETTRAIRRLGLREVARFLDA